MKVRALFWSLELLLQQGKGYQRILHIPLIERVQNMAWAVTAQLRGEDPSPK